MVVTSLDVMFFYLLVTAWNREIHVLSNNLVNEIAITHET
jgi:hypothetical protein